jgi:hypothetical protein
MSWYVNDDYDYYDSDGQGQYANVNVEDWGEDYDEDWGRDDDSFDDGDDYGESDSVRLISSVVYMNPRPRI